MTPTIFKLLCVLIVAYGVALCFFGYRVFRAFLATLGLIAGMWVGLIVTSKLGLKDLARWLIVAGIGLMGGVVAVLVYFAGIFLAAGASLAGLVLMVSVHLGRPASLPVLAGIFVVGGLLVVVWHRRLIVYVTALGGALLTLAGLAPLLTGAPVPESLTAAWFKQQVSGLPGIYFVAAVVLAFMGSFAQQRWTARSLLVFGTSHATTALRRPWRRARDRDRGRRTHGAICPRCGGIVDPDALYCHRCGNDRWD